MDSSGPRRDAPPARGHGQGGRHVALRWRIRHKLLFGLGVVVGIIGLLITGTLYGLAAFSATVKTADSKIAELHFAEALKRQVSELRSMAERDNIDELEHNLPEQTKIGRAIVHSY